MTLLSGLDEVLRQYGAILAQHWQTERGITLKELWVSGIGLSIEPEDRADEPHSFSSLDLEVDYSAGTQAKLSVLVTGPSGTVYGEAQRASLRDAVLQRLRMFQDGKPLCARLNAIETLPAVLSQAVEAACGDGFSVGHLLLHVSSRDPDGALNKVVLN